MSDLKFELCPDGHRCDNGSKCVEVETDEGSFTCDCDAIQDGSVYAGLKCEHEATDYCNDQNVISRNSFCTNGGQCTELVSETQAHFACDCTDEYMGDHCEYTKGVELPDHVKDSISNNGNNSGGGGLAGGAVAVIVIVVIAVLAVGLFLIRKKLRRWDDPTDSRRAGGSTSTAAAPELVLDADGSVLTSAVKSGAGVNSPTFSQSGTMENADVYEIGDVDDDDEEKQEEAAARENGAPAVETAKVENGVGAMENGTAPAEVAPPVVPPPAASPVVPPPAASPAVAPPAAPVPAPPVAPPPPPPAEPLPASPIAPPPAADPPAEPVPAPAAAPETPVEDDDEEPTEPEIV